MVGHKYYQITVQIDIPKALVDDDRANLNVAEMLQSLGDATFGLRGKINPTYPNSRVIGDQLDDGELRVSAYSSCDGVGSQT